MSQQEQKIVLTCIIILIVIFANNFEKNHLDKKRKELINRCIYLLADKIPNRKPVYEAKASIYDRFYKNKYDNMALTALATDILKHCGYKPAALCVKVEEPDKLKAGQYQIRGNTSIITLYIKSSYTHSQIMGILVHECMHFYLKARGVGYHDTAENEILTDVTTVYMGFGRYTAKAADGRIGYISKNEINYINKILKKIYESVN